MLYRVVFSGEIRKGFDPVDVKRKVAALYKTDVSRVEELFTGRRVAVGRETDHETALRRKAALEGAGLVCSVELAPAEKRLSPLIAARSGAGCGNPGGNGGAAGPQRLSGEPATVTPVLGPASVFHSPMKCLRITGFSGGINLNRADEGEVPYEGIRLASAFSARENERPVQRILLFLAGRERPFIADASDVRYADFPGAAGGGALESLRAFIAHLCEANPSMMLDAATLDFLRGGRLPVLDKDEDTLSTALARMISPGEDGHGAGVASLPDEKGLSGRRTFRRAGRGRPGERSALWDAGERKGPIFGVIALAALAVVAAVLIALPGGGDNEEAFAGRDEFVMGHLRDACMAAMRQAIKNPGEAVTLEKLREGGYSVPEALELTVLDGTWHSFGMSARHRKGGKTFVADKQCRVVEKTAE